MAIAGALYVPPRPTPEASGPMTTRLSCWQSLMARIGQIWNRISSCWKTPVSPPPAPTELQALYNILDPFFRNPQSPDVPSIVCRLTTELPSNAFGNKLQLGETFQLWIKSPIDPAVIALHRAMGAAALGINAQECVNNYFNRVYGSNTILGADIETQRMFVLG